jgi:hypothetical protein
MPSEGHDNRLLGTWNQFLKSSITPAKSCKTCDGIPCARYGKIFDITFTFPDGQEHNYCTEWQDDGIDRYPEIGG